MRFWSPPWRPCYERHGDLQPSAGEKPSGCKDPAGNPTTFLRAIWTPWSPWRPKKPHHVTGSHPSGAWAKESHLRSRRATASFSSATWRSVEMGNMWCGKPIPINLPFGDDICDPFMGIWGCFNIDFATSIRQKMYMICTVYVLRQVENAIHVHHTTIIARKSWRTKGQLRNAKKRPKDPPLIQSP